MDSATSNVWNKFLNGTKYICIFKLITPATLLRLFRQASVPGGFSFFRAVMKYAKPPLSITDQISLLRSRGMFFSDSAIAESALESLNYYRLSAYWLPFETPPIENVRTLQQRLLFSTDTLEPVHW